MCVCICTSRFDKLSDFRVEDGRKLKEAKTVMVWWQFERLSHVLLQIGA
jgi:hypothetical protein